MKPMGSGRSIERRADERAVGSARVGAAWALSVAVHAVAALSAIGVVTWLADADPAPPRTAPRRQDDEVFVLELPSFDDPPPRVADAHVRSPDQAPDPPRSGGPVDPRPDTDRKGRGGDATSRATAVNLADRDDRIHLERSVLSRLDRDQLARLRSGRERRSWEDWRASREPTELTFLALGTMRPRDPERVPDAPFDPGAGSRRSAPRSAEGGEVVGDDGRLADVDDGRDGPADAPDQGEGLRRGSEQLGDETPSHGVGWPSKAMAQRETEAGRAAYARPLVDRSDPSIPAPRTDVPSDTVDAEQEVASMLQSIVHASTAGGPHGTGRGGAEGGGRWTGSGGTRGSGSTSTALGTGGPGPAVASAADPAREAYLRNVMTKVHPLWAGAFPKWAIAEGKQGTAIVSFTIEADGTVSSASVTRPSGVAEFDANVRAAILRGAPYGPLPASLGPRLRWAMPFVAKNEAVRPKDAAEGITPR